MTVGPIAKMNRLGIATGADLKARSLEQITRSRSVPSFVESRADLGTANLALLAALFPTRKGIRLLGMSLSSLNTEGTQGDQLSLRYEDAGAA